MSLLAGAGERVEGGPPGIAAWTTTRLDGSYGLGSQEPVEAVMARWSALQDRLATAGVHRLASAHQVHGADVAVHEAGWRGWLRLRGVDGHLTTTPGTALVVTIADCTPVFVSHPAGAVAALHAGWRGTAGRILRVGLDLFAARGYAASECDVHLGPAICGACYEVGPEVLEAVHGRRALGKGQLDTRDVLEKQARELGVVRVTRSASCTRCDGDRFYSHRAGDPGRQLGVIALLPRPNESS